jgi:hypothetical protein
MLAGKYCFWDWECGFQKSPALSGAFVFCERQPVDDANSDSGSTYSPVPVSFTV